MNADDSRVQIIRIGLCIPKPFIIIIFNSVFKKAITRSQLTRVNDTKRTPHDARRRVVRYYCVHGNASGRETYTTLRENVSAPPRPFAIRERGSRSTHNKMIFTSFRIELNQIFSEHETAVILPNSEFNATLHITLNTFKTICSI